MAFTPSPLIRWRLAQLASHLVVALIALVVIGGATRVMEAGLACPDWPLCYGTFFPGHQMNIQVFLEWFHRLDAFVVGIALCVQLGVVWIWRLALPGWLPLASAFLVILVSVQGGLGALTVVQLLPSGVVTAHLGLALTLVAAVSGLTQCLLSSSRDSSSPLWWRFMSGASLLLVMAQSVLGGRMATEWAAQRCIAQGQVCEWLHWHRFSAIPVASFVIMFIVISFLAGGWSRRQWPFLLVVFLLVLAQISLGLLVMHLGLAIPFVTVAHQLVAALLVAFLSALTFRSPGSPSSYLPLIQDFSSLETCHG